MLDLTVSTAGMRVVRLLVGNPPQTVAELIDAVGVTRTAITEQLNDLVASGFAKRSTERLAGRGRPRHLYAATDASLRLLFPNNERLVVPAIWRAIDSIGGEALTKRVLRRVARTVADHYKRRIKAKAPEKRLRELIELLREEGGLVEGVEDNGKLTLRKRSCPFISMVDENRSVCYVDRDMMSEVVGRRVRRTACRHEGDPCCTFEIVPKK